MSSEIKWQDVAHYYVKSEISIKTEDVGIREMLGVRGTRGVMYATRAHAMHSRWSQHKPILIHLEDMPDARRLKVLEDRDWWAFERDHEQARLIARDDPQWNGKLVQWEVFRHDKWLYGQVSLTNDHITNLIKYIKEGYDMFGLIESGQAIRKEKEL